MMVLHLHTAVGSFPDSKPQLLPTCLGAVLVFMIGSGICNLARSTLHLHLCRAVLPRFRKPSQPWSLVMRYGIAFGGIARSHLFALLWACSCFSLIRVFAGTAKYWIRPPVSWTGGNILCEAKYKWSLGWFYQS
jgi:hypothetical protein